MEDDLQEFDDLKARFDNLIDKLQQLHAEMRKLHSPPLTGEEWKMQFDIIGCENQLVNELSEIVGSALALTDLHLKNVSSKKESGLPD